MGSVMTVTSPAPLQTWLPLAALPTAPGVARGHVRSVAREWGLAGLAETAALLASELVTNAVQASDRLETTAGLPVIRLQVSSDGTALVIHVWDACEEMPVRQDAGPDAVGGRGLLLVETLGKDWGAYRQARGKVVWVLINLPDDP
jgi:anti-sigma regulatory factor (Ser/Thr protein kinase)